MISVIIPCASPAEDIGGLMKDLSGQDIGEETEIIRVDGVRPPGRARNLGVDKAKGDILVFIDSDIRLESGSFLSGLLSPVRKDANVGMTCASIKVPPGASWFQRRYAEEVPHSESPDVSELTEVQVASSACCAVRRDIFSDVGGFDEKMLRGEDSVISSDIRKAGYQVALVPDTRCYHPQPEGLLQLARTGIRNGYGAASVDVLYPDLNLDVHPEGVTLFSGKKSVSERAKRFSTDLFKAVCGMKLFLIASKSFYALGYISGRVRFSLKKRL